MLSISEAFRRFKNRLEITRTEQQDAGSRQKRIRRIVDENFNVKRDFLTGSYRRHTKTKPLKDVDIFVILDDDHKNYLDDPPGDVLEDVRDVLVEEFGVNRVAIQRRSVRIDYGVEAVDDLTGRVMSFDVTPAFWKDTHYLIPDCHRCDWMRTDPEIHAVKATEANQSCDQQWKPVVKMLKKWNDHNDKPIKPSFLIEVMSLSLLDGWEGSYPLELKAWFATASNAIGETWKDPAGWGHPVSDRMVGSQLAVARDRLKDAEAAATGALVAEERGEIGVALSIWQDLFGSTFAKT